MISTRRVSVLSFLFAGHLQRFSVTPSSAASPMSGHLVSLHHCSPGIDRDSANAVE